MESASIKNFCTVDALELLHKGFGSTYFVPDGYIPVLVRNTEDTANIRQRHETDVATQIPVDNLWQTRLPTKVMQTKNEKPERQKQVKKPPWPPNAFILYRKDIQVGAPFPLKIQD